MSREEFNALLQRKPNLAPNLPAAGPLQGAKSQRPVRDESLAAHERKAKVRGRVHVRIVASNPRFRDIDNVYGGVKFLLDVIRRAGLILDDSPEAITLEVLQKKGPPETLIEIFSHEPPPRTTTP